MLFFPFRIQGHSMQPTLFPGSIVCVSSIPYFFRSPKFGDIVAFRKENKVFIKRITKILNNTYFLQGDHTSDSFDSRQFGWIEQKHILGKVIYILRKKM